MRGDLRRGLERSQIAVDTKAEAAHEQEEHRDPEPANHGKYWCAMGRIRFQLGISALCITAVVWISRPYVKGLTKTIWLMFSVLMTLAIIRISRRRSSLMNVIIFRPSVSLSIFRLLD